MTSEFEGIDIAQLDFGNDGSEEETFEQTLQSLEKVKRIDIAQLDFGNDGSEEETFEQTLKSLEKVKRREKEKKIPKPKAERAPESTEDFIRNFLAHMGMKKTLETFQQEWLKAKVQKGSSSQFSYLPDIHQQNEVLTLKVRELEQKIHELQDVLKTAAKRYEKLRRGRDYHRLHHRQATQERDRLTKDLQRLRTQLDRFQPALDGMQKKYQSAMKSKMLATLQRDRLSAKVKTLENALGKESTTGEEELEEKDEASEEEIIDAPWPSLAAIANPMGSDDDLFALPEDQLLKERIDAQNFTSAAKPIQTQSPIANVVAHPRRKCFATASDDGVWRVLGLPDGELILTGAGHTSWMSSAAFHPSGAVLATSSGDSTVRLWDFSRQSCVCVFAEHASVVWDVAFHCTGDFLASSSSDCTIRIWDVGTAKNRGCLRGHADSVNGVTFKPHSNMLLSCSADKTVSMWDSRTGQCVQTLFGHTNAVNSVRCSESGHVIVSCDADGSVLLWDVRGVGDPCLSANKLGPYSANSVAVDKYGQCVCVASDDGSVKVLYTAEGSVVVHEGHLDGVQGVCFTHDYSSLLSVSADMTVRVWK
ncbi:Sperm-associated antigen 16 protein [Aduncisulcus paluster]|uniref:Sperm-associated antigen 16 protein n=1 Tax=Aduncisulcus paluster TaxID=2918883 RepID=A0ABQ5KTD4_9EUKA|nr:Sperm-associated antigen 16 protein [Aduncisulcus paluster]